MFTIVYWCLQLVGIKASNGENSNQYQLAYWAKGHLGVFCNTALWLSWQRGMQLTNVIFDNLRYTVHKTLKWTVLSFI